MKLDHPANKGYDLTIDNHVMSCPRKPAAFTLPTRRTVSRQDVKKDSAKLEASLVELIHGKCKSLG